MAIQILPPKDDWGSQLGRILGTGLGAGLERYGTVKGIQALGIPQEQAVGMSALPQKILGNLITSYQRAEGLKRGTEGKEGGIALDQDLQTAYSSGAANLGQVMGIQAKRESIKNRERLQNEAKIERNYEKVGSNLNKYIDKTFDAPDSPEYRKFDLIGNSLLKRFKDRGIDPALSGNMAKRFIDNLINALPKRNKLPTREQLFSALQRSFAPQMTQEDFIEFATDILSSAGYDLT